MIDNPIKRKLVKGFLKKFKKIISNGHMIIIPRRNEYASQTEMTLEAIKIVLFKLRVDDCVKYDIDRDRTDDILFIFKKDDGELLKIYVKLKIDIQEGEEVAKVLSFHPDNP